MNDPHPSGYRASELAVQAADETTPAAGDAIALLKQEHQHLRELFAAVEVQVNSGAPDTERGELAAQICAALIAHTGTEEALFYPAVRAATSAPEHIDDADAQHADAKALVATLQSMQPQDAAFTPTLRQLCEAFEHHVRHEEGPLFASARQAGLDLKALGEKMAARHEVVLAELQQSD